MNDHDFYHHVIPAYFQIEDATIAVRRYGKGKPLVFLHGFFVSGYTWRKVIPALAKQFTCYVLDLPGFGDSSYSKATDFTFTAQARRLSILFRQLGICNDMNIIAQDTGASIARLVALDQQNTIHKLILINTEIPNHRPPFIPMHQFLAKLPCANWLFRMVLRFDTLVYSPLLLAPFFYDKSKLKDKNNTLPYILPLQNPHKMFGMLQYLRGIEWKVVDDFEQNHRLLTMDTLLLWGEADPTFPIHLAEQMKKQFGGPTLLRPIPKACLMPHEECPQHTLKEILNFMGCVYCF